MNKLYLLIIIFLNFFTIFSEELIVNFYHHNLYYSYKLYENKIFFLEEPFYSLYFIDEKQINKIILTSLEKSKVISLKFVGDKYEFNNIEISCIQYYPEISKSISKNFFEDIILNNILDQTEKEIVKKYFWFNKKNDTYILKDITDKMQKIKLYSILNNYKTIVPLNINKYFFNNVIIQELQHNKEKLDFILSKYSYNITTNSYLLKDDINSNDIKILYQLLKPFDYLNKKYLIKDNILNISISFGIGEYDSIVLFSILNFNEKEITFFDKIATSFTVKLLLKKITNKIELEEKIPRSFQKDYFLENILLQIDNTDDKQFIEKMYKLNRLETEYILKSDLSLDNEKRILFILDEIKNKKELEFEKNKIELNNFISQLDKIKKEDIFEYLKKFTNYNFSIDLTKYNINSNWIKPWDLFYYKKSDYKSITYFYYYIFNNLKRKNFNIKLFVVYELKKVNKEDYFNYKNLTPSEQRQKDMLFRYVDPSYNREELFNYYPPDLNNSILIFAIQLNEKWLYTTGKNWVDSNISIPERVCYDFYKKGCYYSEVKNPDTILFEDTIYEKDLNWHVYFDIK